MVADYVSANNVGLKWNPGRLRVPMVAHGDSFFHCTFASRPLVLSLSVFLHSSIARTPLFCHLSATSTHFTQHIKHICLDRPPKQPRMGNSASGDEGRYRLGYHVLRVKTGSPAHQAGLRPYFDYIMAVNDTRLNTESTLLRDQMETSVDKPMVLDVYSTREQALRRIELVPRRNWSGADEDGLLGCSIRFTLFDTIIDIVWHVLDITPGSPAEQAGLCAHADYVIGTPLGIMRGEGDLYDLVEDYIGDPLPLHVYNVDRNQVREVVIVPSEEWGGEGLLGCDVGYGYLHRLPRQPSPLLKEQKESAKDDATHKAEQHVYSQESIVPGLDGKGGVNVSTTLVDESKDEHADSAASADISEKERIPHSNTQPSGSPELATRLIDAQENPQQPGHEPPLTNGSPIAPVPTQENDLTPAAVTQPTLYPHVSSPPLYPKVAVHDLPLNGSTLANEDADSKEHNATETTAEGEANDTSTEEQSAEYRAQMERDQTTEKEAVIQDSKSPVQDNPGMTKDKGEDKVVEDNSNSMMEQQEADLAVHEFVVEGMIRNMALGSTVFPL
ncbi:hypothetical protein KVV02_003502 [Mortierella alpina]|uniref:PDZ GRASP-type domain-containing protein n=1 Tax=Mortierella alpina TaxID=64518 RepID=A0A9P8CX76_MORAP|nr:hypothetical protein KVV02_003502 [Mortierella alpina]